MLTGLPSFWWPTFTPATHPTRPSMQPRLQPVSMRHYPGVIAPAWGPSRREATPAAGQAGGSSTPP